MAHVHGNESGNYARPLEIPPDGALRLDGRGRVASGAWALSLVPFGTERGTPRWCVIAAPGVHATLGATPLPGGVAELHDRDHVLVGDLELIFSSDAVPVPLVADTGAPCAACCQAPGTGDCTRLYRCPRCGVVACNVCWQFAPMGRCLTPGCTQPAALDRALWAPAAPDFLLADADEETPA
jgi:hypothetical protein